MAIVPVKPLADAKTRLAGVMDETARVDLTRRLLARTLKKLTRARGLARVVVISRDELVLQMARTCDAFGITETNATLNAALEQATRVCVASGARAVLVVPADLPRLRVRDVEKMIALSEPPPRMVIAPAQRDGGTNALLCNPVKDFTFSFGENSFERHCAAAQRAGLEIVRYDSDTVTFDLDVPEDLEIEYQRSKIRNAQSEIVNAKGGKYGTRGIVSAGQARNS